MVYELYLDKAVTKNTCRQNDIHFVKTLANVTIHVKHIKYIRMAIHEGGGKREWNMGIKGISKCKI